MLLPTIKHQPQATRREGVAFGGLNYTDTKREGELAGCENLSGRRYPYLAPRLPRQVQQASACSALFAWDGKALLVEGTTLRYDGKAVGTVSTGAKQFAVVNTKVCIWPDKKYLDLKSMEFGALEASVAMAQGTMAQVWDGAITLTGGMTQEMAVRYAYKGWSTANGCLTKVYTAASWSEAGGWALTGEREVALDVLGGAEVLGLEILRIGDLVMLTHTPIQGNYQLSTRDYYIKGQPSQPKEVTYGTYEPASSQGYYGKISSFFWSYDGSGEDYTSAKINIEFYVVNGADAPPNLAGSFCVGDRLVISGCTTIPANNTKEGTQLVLTGIVGDQLQFAAGSFTPGTENGPLVIRRPLPQLDYICQSENRLWGVSNQDKTIYASALGDPKNFYIYSGLSTDSYAVAVGSEGDFSAISAYGNGVLCWKERWLHKILGGFPAEYQMASYQYAGVRGGCQKSLANINEVLYYLGADGVYAYGGGAPQLISQGLGDGALEGGVAGSDGRRYYLSAKAGTGSWSMLVYDTTTGLWLREDAVQVVDFCRIGDGVRFLAHEQIYTMEQGEEVVEWMAQLAPFYETAQGRKRYSKLFLRVELPLGAWLLAKVRCDGGPWREVGRVVGRGKDTVLLPIAPHRCDCFEVMLSGKGDCAVLAMVREFRIEARG